MVAIEKLVTISSGEVKCMDLTFGYLLSLTEENPETKQGTVVDGTNLTEDEVMKLRVSEVEELYQAILRLTYPHLYDENGEQKDLPEEKVSKKKALAT